MPDELFLIDGNSLAYRAFFALPESIATSTGRADERDLRLRLDAREDPDRVRPEGRRSWSGTPACPAARRSTPSTRPSARSRPDLLKEQWPHLEPLVDAFGYRTSRSTATRPTT